MADAILSNALYFCFKNNPIDYFFIKMKNECWSTVLVLFFTYYLIGWLRTSIEKYWTILFRLHSSKPGFFHGCYVGTEFNLCLDNIKTELFWYQNSGIIAALVLICYQHLRELCAKGIDCHPWILHFSSDKLISYDKVGLHQLCHNQWPIPITLAIHIVPIAHWVSISLFHE